MSKWIAEFDLEDGDTMPEHMDLEYKGAKIDFYCKPVEQEPVIDKIRAEIEELDRYYDNDYFSNNNCPMYKCNEVLLIIDKYKAESEVEE